MSTAAFASMACSFLYCLKFKNVLLCLFNNQITDILDWQSNFFYQNVFGFCSFEMCQ